MSARFLRFGAAASVCVGVLAAGAVPALADIRPQDPTPANAMAIAQDVASDPSQVTGAQFTAAPGLPGGASPGDTPPAGEQPNALATSAPLFDNGNALLASFPVDGSAFGLLSTGSASLADDPNDSPATSRAWDYQPPASQNRGSSVFDASTLQINVNVPAGANCASLAYRFLSEEYPEFIGSRYNDAFIAEFDPGVDGRPGPWTTTSENEITAPDDFATATGKPVSINGSEPTRADSPSESGGTTYDSATGLVNTKTPITPGSHQLFLSIFDQGDSIYDSAVFLDRLQFFNEDPSTCKPPQVIPPPPPPGESPASPAATPPSPGPSTPPAAPSNAFGFQGGSVTFNNAGTAVTLTFDAPGPGTFTVREAGSSPYRSPDGATAARKKRKQQALVKPVTARANAAGPVKVTVKLTPAGKKILRKKGRVKVRMSVTFAPDGGSPATQRINITFKKPGKKKGR
jgi:hypothetical protein